eukprot:jgi/Botrbrau1/6497/Bobra.0034s0070.1
MLKLKAEKEALERALRKELGPEVDLGKAIEEGSTWRGRAQQISILKERITDLQSQQGSEESSEARSKHDQSHRQHIENIRVDKQKEVDKLRAELAACQAMLSQQQLRVDGSLARRGTLESEGKLVPQQPRWGQDNCQPQWGQDNSHMTGYPLPQAKSLRAVVAALKEKSNNDDILIKALQQSGAGKLTKKLSRKSSGSSTDLAGPEGEAALQAHIQILQERVSDRDRSIKEQDEIILGLRALLHEAVQASAQADAVRRPSGVPILVDNVDC